jgi:hypothetical protein
MQWDLGLQALGALLLMSLLFGAFTQLVFWRRVTLWVGAVATVAAFVVGVFVSEVMFGWATGEDLQPNIDGLSFDEVLLGLVLCGLVVLAIRFLARGRLAPPVAH